MLCHFKYGCSLQHIGSCEIPLLATPDNVSRLYLHTVLLTPTFRLLRPLLISPRAHRRRAFKSVTVYCLAYQNPRLDLKLCKVHQKARPNIPQVMSTIVVDVHKHCARGAARCSQLFFSWPLVRRAHVPLSISSRLSTERCDVLLRRYLVNASTDKLKRSPWH
jgi:hypothetical protein